MSHRRNWAAVLAGAVLAGGVAAGDTVVAAAPRPDPVPAGGPVVTLVTGDRVSLGGPGGATVRPAAGREHLGFAIRTDDRGHVHVVPTDAAGLVASGRVDPLLFDVTGLVAARYDDASRDDLPLIVDYPGATPRSAAATVTRELPSLGAAAVRADRSAAFWAQTRDTATKIWLDAPVHSSLDRSVRQIGAPAAWDAGHTGAGTTVAVLDTGIDATHPDLDDAVVGAQDFTDSAGGTDDLMGHGTHVASTITGDGERYRGVAPDTKLLNGKVLDDYGFGSMSSVLAGMEWAAASGADVVNMSLGSNSPSDGTDPISQAVNRLTAETGTLFVVSAGNGGQRTRPGSPAAAEGALTVGAVDREDRLADFSTRGPRPGDSGIKPDVTAPGVGIVAARAKNSEPQEPVGDAHAAKSGTSMAAPHVAGAAAILAGQHPDWTPERLKAALMNTADPAEGSTVFEQGAGRVDVAAAVDATVTATGSVSLGRAEWPHADDQPLTKTVTYSNSGTAPVTLDLATDVPNAPAGMFTVEPDTLTVPAGGQATAAVTADTRVEAADGTYTGVLIATGAGLSLRTPIAVEREVESYDLTMTTLNDIGVPTGDMNLQVRGIERDLIAYPWDASGTVTMRLPKGTYYANGLIDSANETTFTYFVEPTIELTRDTHLTFDSRKANPLGYELDQPNATPGAAQMRYERSTAQGAGISGLSTSDVTYVRVLPSMTTAPDEEFLFSVEARLAEPDGDGEWPNFEGSPYLYGLYWEHRGRVPADLHRTYTDRELAHVRGTHAVSTPGLVGVREDMVTGQLPFTLDEFYTPNRPVYPIFHEESGAGGYSIVNQADTVIPKVYQRGRTTHERYNVGVFGPGFPFHEDYPNYVMSGRYLDLLGFNLPLVSDQDPGRTSVTMPQGVGTMQLLHDGQVIAESDYPTIGGFWQVPPEEATYTVRTTGDRSAVSRLSTKVSGEWTFRSKHVPSTTPEPLPLMAVRFAPKLDIENTAPAGRRFRFPVYVQRSGSPTPIAVAAPPTVEVSYDDGTTWRPVRLSRDRDRWTAEVDHPRNAAFVSLRASVADREGNSAKHTIIRAYALR